jgi:hypothetical protein
MRSTWSVALVVVGLAGGPAGYLTARHLLQTGHRAPYTLVPGESRISIGEMASGGPGKSRVRPHAVGEGTKLARAMLAGPPGATALRLPPIGSFEERMHGNSYLLAVRSEVRRDILARAGYCEKLGVSSNAEFALMVPVRVASGVVEVSPISRVDVAPGGEVPEAVMKCLTKLVAKPFTLPDSFGSRVWVRVPDFEGETLVPVRMGNKKCPSPPK